jgi:hypothetical protein
MLTVTQTASVELEKALNQDTAKGKNLIIYFQGQG